MSALEKLHSAQLEREREHAAVRRSYGRKSRLCARSWDEAGQTRRGLVLPPE